MSSSTKITNTRYLNIRKKMDSINIFQHFDLNHIDIVESLINKIEELGTKLKLKDNLYNEIQEKLENKNIIYNSSLLENQHLIQENNQLHKQLIDHEKIITKSIQAKELEINRLSNEKTEMKYLNNMYFNKINTFEKENNSLKRRLSYIINKIYDSNFNEQSLRKILENDENILKINKINNDNKEITSLNLTKPKVSSIEMAYTIINISTNNDKSIINDRINETFGNKSQINLDINAELLLLKKEYQSTLNALEVTKNELFSLKEYLKNHDVKEIHKDNSNNNKITISDEDSIRIIDYLKKEKKIIEAKNNKKEEILIEEIRKMKEIINHQNIKLKEKGQKQYSIENYDKINRTNQKNKNLKEEENNKSKNEITLLKQCITQQNDEIIRLKTIIKNKEESSNLKIEQYEVLFKELNESLNNARNTIYQVDSKNKEISSINNSEKTLLSNKITDLNNMCNTTNQEKELLEVKYLKLQTDYETSLEKINQMASIIFQKDNIIDMLKQIKI